MLMLEPGIYRELPAATYHALPYASNSRLSRLKRSAAHLRAYMETPAESTLALRLGRATHTAVLEPHLFDADFVTAEPCTAIKTDGARCTNNGKELTESHGWRCGQHLKGTNLSLSQTRIVMSPSELATCHGMRAAVMSHPLAANLIRRATDIELTLVWDDPETGVRCKARPDCYAPDVLGGTFGDLKTCDDARPEAFSRSAASYGYFTQAAHYLDGAAVLGLPVETFAFIATEKPSPHGVMLYQPDQDDLFVARDEIRRLLGTWAMCHALNEWPTYPAEVQTLTLPAWARRAPIAAMEGV